MKHIILTTALAFYGCFCWAQNVGIGISTPISKLHVTGTGTNYSPDALNVAAHEAGLLIENRNITSNANAGIVSYASGSTFANRGVFGIAGGSGSAFNIGVGGIADSTSTGTNYGLVGYAANGAANFAAGLYGKVQIQDGSQGANKVYTSDAAGTGTWTSFSTLGLLSGSGTLNYIPKFTPDGVTLGNSQVFDDGTLVGINNATPLAKFHVTGGGSLYSAPGVIAIEPGILAEDTATSANAKSGVYGYTNGGAVNRAVHGIAGGSSSNFNIGVQGEAFTTSTGTNYGVVADASGGSLNIGVYGQGDYAIYGQSATGGYAGVFEGTVAIQDGTQAAGNVFTSDASGIGSWQAPSTSVLADIRLQGLSGNISVPAFTIVPVTQWNAVNYEDGGSNFNAGTGEYTVPVAGLYHVTGLIIWNQFTSDGWADLVLTVNGGTMDDAVTNAPSAGPYNYVTTQISTDVKLNAGDIIQFSLFQASSGTQATTSFTGDNHFSVHLVH